ncbi:FadR/GntR family transcriptional regulator [Actibacterium mucosum]|uniref:FadR/GntR family transcriptional regulator n=1 Tax=Actibacterium mucosum TaxID=1087332 RepID=UPI0005586B68|nr:FadR/GntR family transcriptional regulator [Actibacterium mucosum]
MPQFKEIRRTGQLPDLIASEIMSQILGGELKPGDVLPTEAALAESFGVSRNVVREAIARLRSDGLIETKQGRGATVRPPSERETFRVDLSALEETTSLADLFELRGILEIEAAGLAAQRRTEEDLTRLQAAIDNMAGQQEFDEKRLEADAEFHRAMGTATKNAFLATIVDYLSSRLKETTRATNRIYRDGDLIAVTIGEHEKILAAVKAQDAQAVREAMQGHIRGAAKRLGVDLPD